MHSLLTINEPPAPQAQDVLWGKPSSPRALGPILPMVLIQLSYKLSKLYDRFTIILYFVKYPLTSLPWLAFNTRGAISSKTSISGPAPGNVKPMPEKLQRNTLKEQAYQALREMIASHRFTSGTWINAEHIAGELGVSRTPVWQALKQLEAEGLVQHVPHRGARMIEMTPAMALDLYEVRGVLEGLAASRLAANPRPGALERMERILARQRLPVEQGDAMAYSRSDFEFHAVLYESCGNWLLQEQLEQIKNKARPFVRDITPILSQLHQDHHRLLQALRAGDAAAASQVMIEHNQRARRLVEHIQAAGAAKETGP